MNAYELADELLRDNTQLTVKAAYMLRQQADRIAELEKELKHYKMAWNMAENELENQTKPLSDDEILEMTIWNKNLYELYVEMDKEDMIAFARAIEKRHGIK